MGSRRDQVSERSRPRPHRSVGAWVSVLAVALATTTVLSGCGAVPSAVRTKAEPATRPAATTSAAPSASSSARSPGATNGAGVPFAPASYDEQHLTWKDCSANGQTFECATLKVPLDYRAPKQSINISVLKRPADDQATRLGSLVVNPGGPGASGVEWARSSAAAYSPEIVARYDIVGFDPRGVGQSTPIRCIGSTVMDDWLSMDVTPDTASEVSELVGFDTAFGQACKRNTGDLLGHVSTVEAAADMDLLRSALGEERLDFFGSSYGTLLGATYAQEFPSRVGRFVLDGAISPTATGDEAAKAQAAGFETALDAFLATCVAATDCPLGTSETGARARVSRLLDDLDAEPLRTSSSRELTEQLGETGIAEALYGRYLWPSLRLAFQQALGGDGTGLLALADQYANRVNGAYTSSLLQANVAVDCLDSGRAGSSVADAERQSASYRKAAPVFGESSNWVRVLCHDWPVRAEFPVPHLTAAGAAPIVVVGTTRDPATPYAWAEELASTLTSGVLVTRDGDGHTGYHQGSRCVDAAVDAYLLDGTVPKDGTRCS